MTTFLSDVHSFGFNVLIQDADVTWRQDPRQWLSRPEASDFDAQIMSDGRPENRDKKYNSGFMWYRNNCKARAFLSSLSNIVEYILTFTSDQQAVNRLLATSYFSALNVSVLDPEKFVNGHLWNPWGMNPNHLLSLEAIVWHPS